MATIPVWRGTARETRWPALDADLQADVLVVGGGITGVTAALRLAEAGRSVVLLEAADVGAGDTGGSTGNLYATVSGGLRQIREKWDASTAHAVAHSRAEAVAAIEQQVARMGSECAFRRCDLHLYAASEDARADVDAEYDALKGAGLAVRRDDAAPSGLPRAHGAVVVLDGQAQFHPLAYVRALAERAAAAGCRLFERSAVVEVDADRGVARTSSHRVTARDVVLATHSPSGFHVVQAGMVPSREYGLALRLAGPAFPAGIFWAKGRDRLSIRGLDTPAGHWLICVGEEHRSGQHDAHAAAADLERIVRERLAPADVAFRWSAQNFRSPDGLPYIGKDHTGAWIATGFATDGLTYGTLAAHLIADRILGRENRWEALYRATRLDPVKAAKGTADETLSVATAFVHDYVTRRSRTPLDALAPGAGAVVEIDGDAVAAYRDPGGQLHAVSPVCTHLKCRVRWNALETSWDCPCHGSRFAPDGSVLSGPAVQPLERKDVGGG